MLQMSNSSRKHHEDGYPPRSDARHRTARINAKATKPLDERDHLLLLATRRFCGEESHNRLSIDQYKEAFYALVGTVKQQTLGEVSGLLSANPFSPKEAILYLATESIDIARPILRRSQVLNQLDMIGLVEKCSLEHISVLATRTDLGPSVEKCMRRLNNHTLNINLDRRPMASDGVSGKSAAKMFERITSTSTQSALGVKDVPVAKIEKELPTQIAKKSTQQSLLDAAARGGRLPGQPPSTQSKAKRISAPRSTVLKSNFGTSMERAALTRSRQAMASLMQQRFGLTLETCHTVLADKTGDTLAVLMKSADLNDALANRISLLTFPNVGLSVHNTKRAMRYYAKLDTASCLEAMAQWPKQKNAATQHEAILSDDRREQAPHSAQTSRPAFEAPLEATG